MLEVPEPRAAIFLLDGNAVQPERADFRPEVAGKLIALVDLVGARRNLVARKSCTVSRIASAVSPRSKLNIRYALGIMSGGLRASCGFLAHSLMLWK